MPLPSFHFWANLSNSSSVPDLSWKLLNSLKNVNNYKQKNQSVWLGTQNNRTNKLKQIIRSQHWSKWPTWCRGHCCTLPAPHPGCPCKPRQWGSYPSLDTRNPMYAWPHFITAFDVRPAIMEFYFIWNNKYWSIIYILLIINNVTQPQLSSISWNSKTLHPQLFSLHVLNLYCGQTKCKNTTSFSS